MINTSTSLKRTQYFDESLVTVCTGSQIVKLIALGATNEGMLLKLRVFAFITRSWHVNTIKCRQVRYFRFSVCYQIASREYNSPSHIIQINLEFVSCLPRDRRQLIIVIWSIIIELQSEHKLVKDNSVKIKHSDVQTFDSPQLMEFLIWS